VFSVRYISLKSCSEKVYFLLFITAVTAQYSAPDWSWTRFLISVTMPTVQLSQSYPWTLTRSPIRSAIFVILPDSRADVKEFIPPYLIYRKARIVSWTRATFLLRPRCDGRSRFPNTPADIPRTLCDTYFLYLPEISLFLFIFCGPHILISRDKDAPFCHILWKESE